MNTISIFLWNNCSRRCLFNIPSNYISDIKLVERKWNIDNENRNFISTKRMIFVGWGELTRKRERGREDLPAPAAPSLNTASLWREMERVAVSSRRARTSSGISSGSRRRRVTSPPPPPPWPPPPPGLVDAEYMNTDPYPCNDCNGSLTPPTSPTGPWKKKRTAEPCWEFLFSTDYIEFILLERTFFGEENFFKGEIEEHDFAYIY